MVGRMKAFLLIVFVLFYSLAYSQTDTLKIVSTRVQIGTNDNHFHLYLKNEIPLRGLQLNLSYPADLSPVDVSQTTRTRQLNIEHHIPFPSQINMLIFGYSTGRIMPDTGSVADIIFNVPNNALPGEHPLILQNVYASDENGQNVALKIVDGIIVIGEGVIPVELTNFNALFVKDQNIVRLEWSTRSESNNYGFEIQRSEDGEHFDNIGFVKGNGTTSTFQTYCFFDSNPVFETNYYRLKQVDFDGSVQYSNIIRVTLSLPSNYKLSQNYPNPFNPETTIEYTLLQPGKVDLTIYNKKGKEIRELVQESKPAGYFSTKWDSRNNDGKKSASGIYIYQIEIKTQDLSFVDSKKMILMK
jgi:hypothetical protein